MKRKYLDGILSSLDNQDQLNLNSNDNNILNAHDIFEGCSSINAINVCN